MRRSWRRSCDLGQRGGGLRGRNVDRGQGLVHVDGQIFCKHVREVGLAADPLDFELALADTAFDPIKTLVDRLRLFRAHGVGR